MNKSIVELEIPGGGTVFLKMEDTSMLEETGGYTPKEIQEFLVLSVKAFPRGGNEPIRLGGWSPTGKEDRLFTNLSRIKRNSSSRKESR